MPKKEYGWKENAPPPILHVHSIAKHDVLHAYLIRYLEVLAADPRIDTFRLTLIDGFSGGGLYRHEVTKAEIPGSPLLFLDAINAAEAKISLGRRKPFKIDAHFFFIEKNAETLRFLEKTLRGRGYGPQIDDKIFLVNGSFVDNASKISAFVRTKGRGGRAIFLLDQYGYKDVPLPLLRSLFGALPRAEVLLTFAADALIHYLSNNLEQTVSDIGLKEYVRLENIDALKEEEDWRYLVQSWLSRALTEGSGAAYFTPFFIVSRESNKAYWLVHLSMHARARDEMAALHWQLHTHFLHHGGAGLNMLGYDPWKDRALIRQQFLFDQDARHASEAALAKDLASIVRKNEKGISFGQLFAGTCNTTPATSEIYKTVLGKLKADYQIDVISRSGKPRRKASRIIGTDIVIPIRQLSFTLR